MTVRQSLWRTLKARGWVRAKSEFVKTHEDYWQVIHLFAKSSPLGTDFFAGVGMYLPETAPFATVWTEPPFSPSLETCCLESNTMGLNISDYDGSLDERSELLTADLLELIEPILGQYTGPQVFVDDARSRIVIGAPVTYRSRPLPCMFLAWLLVHEPSSPEIDFILDEVLPSVPGGTEPGREPPLKWSNEQLTDWARQQRAIRPRFMP